MNSRELDDMINRIDQLTEPEPDTMPAEKALDEAEAPEYVGFDEPAPAGWLDRVRGWFRR